ncbi:MULTISPECIES: hypothetical protein [Pirellulaceae]|nr:MULTISPECIES: hypothetical protein [Pirellulaceae]
MTTFVRGSVPGAPDWLDRKVSDGMIVLEQQIAVGGCAVAPLFLPTPFFTCALTYQEEVVGEIRLEVPSLLHRIFLNTGTQDTDYPAEPRDFEILPPEVPDERQYWEVRKHQLGRLSQAAFAVAEEGKFGANVVICNTRAFRKQSLMGLTLNAEYRDVLHFSDGIRLNKLEVLGSVPRLHRIIDLGSKRFFRIGNLADDILALEIRSGSMQNEVVHLVGAECREEPTGMSVLQLIEHNLKT